MSEQLIQLQCLQVELHVVNDELAKAAQPLEQLSELNDDQRQQVADRLRGWFARWESVTQQISQVLGASGATSAADAQMTTAQPDEYESKQSGRATRQTC